MTDKPKTAASKSELSEPVKMPKVAAPKNALIGDENMPDVRKVEPQVHTDAVPAQTTGPPAETVSEVYVHETYVELDKVITDPHSPEAVQVPDAGMGSLDLPIHALAGPTVEEYFASEAKKSDKS